MLHAFVLKRFIALTAAIVLGASSVAFAAPLAGQEDHGPVLSAKTKMEFTQITKEIESQASAGVSSPKMQRYMRGIVARGAETMANPKMQAAHDKILKFLGINPHGNSAIYIFVSWSMPLPMIRAYALEALWTGGELVLRGVPPGISLKTFLLKDLRQLVYNKGAGSVIAIDPRLYDTYKVTVAPTIVLTTDTGNFMCANAGQGSVVVNKKVYNFNYCPPMARDKYWKIGGAVTLGYALRAFRSTGAPSKIVDMYLNSLKRGYAQGVAPGKAQGPYVGGWKAAPVPGTPDKAYQNIGQ